MNNEKEKEIHVYYFFDEVIEAINHFIKTKNLFVTVKKIRRFYEIPSSDRSKTNFIWRNLELLRHYEIIKVYHESPKRTYKLPEEEIQIHYGKNRNIDKITIKKVIKNNL